MKARARATQWREEILLLGEEMWRAMMFCETEAFEWLMRARYILTSPNVTEDKRDGLLAYANERISQERALANAWTTKWDVVRRQTAAIKKEMMSPPRPHPEVLGRCFTKRPRSLGGSHCKATPGLPASFIKQPCWARPLPQPEAPPIVLGSAPAGATSPAR